MVPATLRGPRDALRVRLILDTGSAYTVFHPRLLTASGYDIDAPRTYVDIATASRRERAPLLIIESLEALGVTRARIAALARRLPPGVAADGLLGINFLRGSALTIDFRAGQISVE